MLGPCILGLSLMLLATGLARAQVVLDGTAGPPGPLAGPDFAIGAELGTRAGQNLFHSFERFGLRTGESATFSGPEAIRHVVGRVTGGERSDIDGTLRSTIPGAALWFINPAGVLFGPNAGLDLQGSFHVGTADEIRFADGARFSAREPSSSSFTTAAPEAFGFLGSAPGAILVDRSALEVGSGRDVSLIAADIEIRGGGERFALATDGGQVRLFAAATPAAISVTDDRLPPAGGGDVRLSNAQISAGGDGRGSIAIRARDLTLAEASLVDASNFGDRAPADGHGIRIGADTVLVLGGSIIQADAFAGGDAGTIRITGDRLVLSDRGAGIPTGIASLAAAGSTGGAGGRIDVRADRVEIEGSGLISGLSDGPGRPGDIVVEAGEIALRDGGSIGVNAFGQTALPGDTRGGSITLLATRRIELDRADPSVTSAIAGGTTGPRSGGSLVIRTTALVLGHSGLIESVTSGEGDGGDIVIEVGRLEIGPSSFISTSPMAFSFAQPALFSLASGAGGLIDLTASEAIVVRGTPAEPGAIVAASVTAGPAGSIILRTPVLDMTHGAIASAALGLGAAGTIELEVADRLLLSQSNVSTFSLVGGGGRITISVRDQIVMDEATISSFVLGDQTTTAGDIEIDPRFIIMLGPSAILATAAEGRGGNIRITVDQLIRSPASLIDASAGPAGIDGTVVVSSPDADLSGGLVVLEGGFVDAAALLRETCAARRDAGLSSLTGVGRGGLQPSPDDPLGAAVALRPIARCPAG